MSGYLWKHTHTQARLPRKREVVSQRTVCGRVSQQAVTLIRSGFTSKGSSLREPVVWPSLRCLKRSYCQIQDAHLEGECLTGKRANYKFRLLPWRLADPSVWKTGTPWKAGDGEGEGGGGGEVKPAWAGHPSACVVMLTGRGWQGSQEKKGIFNLACVAKMKLK